MSKRNLKSSDEEGFIRAFCDDLADTEAMYHVHIYTSIVRLMGKRGIDIVQEVWKGPQTASEQPWIRQRYVYPTHASATLYAALYRSAIGIGAAIANKRHDEVGDWQHAPVDQPADTD